MLNSADNMRRSLGRLLALASKSAPVVAAAGAMGPTIVVQAEDGSVPSMPEEAPCQGVSLWEYPANAPCEDRHVVTSTGKVVFAAVMDGHGGWQASEFAKNHLWENILAELAGRGEDTTTATAEGVVGAMVRGYERTDRGFMTAVKPAFDLGFGNVARVGCCAVSAVISPSAIVVANAGDCRAVLGSTLPPGSAPPTPDTAGADAHPLATAGTLVEPGALASTPSALAARGWSAKAMSRDHNSRLQEEKDALAAAHPGEEDIVVCRSPTSCYVKGRLQPTRALGDMYLKYAEFNGRAGTRLYGRHIKAPNTPPYITATPEVQSHKVDPSQDAFLILACDGIWDVLTNEQAVSLVVNDAGDPTTVSERIIASVLALEAAAKGLTVEQLKAIRPGRVRRSMHDDMTAMVLWLDTPAGRALYASKQAQSGGGGDKGASWSWWPFGKTAQAAPASQADADTPASALAELSAASGGLPVSVSYVASHPGSGVTEGSEGAGMRE